MQRGIGRRRSLSVLTWMVAVAAVLGSFLAGAGGASAAPTPRAVVAPHAAGAPDLGPNVIVFDPSMPQSQIQATVDSIAQQQIPNQFGTERYALLFEPGTYGSAATPLNFQVGYYTEVAGLGQNPGDVVINGAIDVFNQCDANNSCLALDNFWRSLSNLTIDVANPSSGPYSGCYAGEFWAVSQAAPMRRVHVVGNTTLMDYCTNPSFASGGFIADSRFDGGVTNGSQQQWIVRNSTLTSWSNGVWNQVFSGVQNAPAQCFPAVANGCGPYTTVATTKSSRERPYLYVDGSGTWQVFVPTAATNSAGETWSATGQTPGRSIPLSSFYLATPTDSAVTINAQLAAGKQLLLTPGVYNLKQALRITHTDTVVLGLGYATLTPTNGNAAIVVGDVRGTDLAGLIVDAGPVSSPVLVAIGDKKPGELTAGRAFDPTALQDVFFRIGGPHEGKATVSLRVNSSHVVLDDLWIWRADHGTGVGWTENTAATGLAVNGNDVNATGLFVEHFQGTEVIWRGTLGSVVFFQNEMPYDPPSQAAWMSGPTTDGYPAFTVDPAVRSFTGYGMGSYSFFNQGVDIFSDNAFVVPRRSGVQLHDLLTIFLDATNGKGGIRNVINGVGGSSTAANPDTPVTVVDYP